MEKMPVMKLKMISPKKFRWKNFKFYASIIFIKSLKNELCEIIFVIKRINTDEN